MAASCPFYGGYPDPLHVMGRDRDYDLTAISVIQRTPMDLDHFGRTITAACIHLEIGPRKRVGFVGRNFRIVGYLTCMQAEASALVDDKEGLLAVWRDRRGYFGGELKKSEYFNASEKHLIYNIPEMVEALQRHDAKAYRKLLWRIRFQRLWNPSSRARILENYAPYSADPDPCLGHRDGDRYFPPIELCQQGS